MLLVFQKGNIKKKNKILMVVKPTGAQYVKTTLSLSCFSVITEKKHGISSTCRGCTTGIKHKKTPLKRRKLDYMDRSNVNGFVKYFSERKYLFKDVFHVEYTEETAIEKFYQASGKRK